MSDYSEIQKMTSEMKPAELAEEKNWDKLNVQKVERKFVGCREAGCDTTSASAEYDSMMLRTGFSNCCKHVDWSEVTTRINNALEHVNDNVTTLIFYHLVLSKDGQKEHLSAFTDTGENFCVYTRTTVRMRTSPILRALAPEVYEALAFEPLDAMTRFIHWIRMQHSMNTGDTNMENVILAAHYGSCHAHIYLLRTMMSLGISPPECRFSDTCALFKVMNGMNKGAKLATLATKHAAWMKHIPGDADSSARVLRKVVRTVFPLARKACYTFSISYEDFMGRTGLNMYPGFAFMI